MDPVQHKLKVFSGNAHPALAREICAQLKVPLGEAYVGRFPDGEVRLQILENVRGLTFSLIQPTCNPVNDNLMELLVMLDALRRASAERITAVIPYYGYARQDRKDRPRVPISSKLVADLLTSAGADRVLALDLHAGQIQGFFNIPVDHLYATPVTVRYFRRLKLVTRWWFLPTQAEWKEPELLPSGSTRPWRSSTSGARMPTSWRCSTWWARLRARPASSSTT